MSATENGDAHKQSIINSSVNMADATKPQGHDKAQDTRFEADKIIEVAAFNREDTDWRVIKPPFVGLKPPMSTHPSGGTPSLPAGPPQTDLGTLDKVPNEMLHAICRKLDFSTAMRLRNVNRAARELVNNSVEYKAVTGHAPIAFYALFRARISDTVTLGDIYTLMCTEKCEKCHLPAAYVYLPTLARCCFKCLYFNPEFCTVPMAYAKKAFSLSHWRIRRHLRVVRAVPNYYGDQRTYLNKLTYFVNYAAARDLTERLTRKTVAAEEVDKHGMNVFMVSAPLPFFDRVAQKAQRPFSCKGCTAAYEMPPPGRERESLSLVLDPRTNIQYTRTGFLEHFRTCAAAKEIWDKSAHGSLPLDFIVSEFIKNKGYFKLGQGRLGLWLNG